MLWSKHNRFHNPEDGEHMSSEYSAPLSEFGTTGVKMVDDWKKSSISTPGAVHSQVSKHTTSGFLPGQSTSAGGEEGDDVRAEKTRSAPIRSRETIFSVQDSRPGPGYYNPEAPSKPHVAGVKLSAPASQSRKPPSTKQPESALIPGPGAYHHRSTFVAPTFNQAATVKGDDTLEQRQKEQMKRRQSTVQAAAVEVALTQRRQSVQQQQQQQQPQQRPTHLTHRTLHHSHQSHNPATESERLLQQQKQQLQSRRYTALDPGFVRSTSPTVAFTQKVRPKPTQQQQQQKLDGGQFPVLAALGRQLHPSLQTSLGVSTTGPAVCRSSHAERVKAKEGIRDSLLKLQRQQEQLDKLRDGVDVADLPTLMTQPERRITHIAKAADLLGGGGHHASHTDDHDDHDDHYNHHNNSPAGNIVIDDNNQPDRHSSNSPSSRRNENRDGSNNNNSDGGSNGSNNNNSDGGSNGSNNDNSDGSSISGMRKPTQVESSSSNIDSIRTNEVRETALT